MSRIENRVITNISKDELGDVFFANKEFEWSEIPDFAVITGINGSGKTRLLRAINGRYSSQTFFKAADQKLNLQTSHNQSNLDSIKYHVYNPGNLESAREDIKDYKYILPWERLKDPRPKFGFGAMSDTSHNFHYTLSPQEIELLNELIEQQLILLDEDPVKSFLYLDDESYNKIKYDIQKIYTKISISDCIGSNVTAIKPARLFQAWKTRKSQIINDIHKKHGRIGDAENKIIKQTLIDEYGTDIAPWVLINEELKRYGLPILNEPSDNFDYELKFGDAGWGHNDLSDGEMIIFSLICLAYDKVGSIQNGSNIAFLLDEFDAHLNPAMSKMFIDIIQRVLVGQFKIQVILTTHSPSTVSYVPEKNLFWMEKTPDKITVTQKPKMEILAKLLPGVLNNIGADTNGNPYLMFLGDPLKKYILFVEGYTDLLYIKEACKYFDCGRKILDNCDIFQLFGAKDCYTFIANLWSDIKDKKIDKKIITLVDGDRMGMNNYVEWFNKKNDVDFVFVHLQNPGEHKYKTQFDCGYIVPELLLNYYGDSLKIKTLNDAGDIHSSYHQIKNNQIKNIDIDSDLEYLKIDMSAEEKVALAKEIIKDIDDDEAKGKAMFYHFEPTLECIAVAIDIQSNF